MPEVGLGRLIPATLLITLQYHTFLLLEEGYAGQPIPGIIVPQQVYQAPVPYTIREPIRFMVNGVPGLSVVNAITNTVVGLENEGITPNVTDAQRASLRIMVSH